jgi:hypothetical protein
MTLRRRITKAQALEAFREFYLPHIPRGDTIMKREEWNNYTDMLCRDGDISDEQYDTWTNPF